MCSETYLCHIGELTLKGGNKKLFEKKLLTNIKASLFPVKVYASLRAGRMYIECKAEDCDKIEFALRDYWMGKNSCY